MLALALSIAALIVAVVAARPGSTAGAAGALALALALPAAGAVSAGELLEAARTTADLACFIAAALWLAAFAERAGLASGAALALASSARGRGWALYALVCALCALLTSAISLDGAVVLMAPVLLALARERGAPLRPLLLGTIATANAASLALPQGNPTNLLVMGRLGLGPGGYSLLMLGPAAAATLVAVVAVAFVERRGLRGGAVPVLGQRRPPGRRGKAALVALGAAGAGGLLAPLAGVSPWWPICAVAALTWAAARLLRIPTPRIGLPFRLAAQLLALLLALQAALLGLDLSGLRHGTTLPVLLATALAASLVASGANNLPASAALASLGIGARTVAAALVGLSAGAFATPHGSVATMLALDRLGREEPRLGRRRYVLACAPAAVLAVATATVVLALLG